jgi:hypothetical protein
MAATNQISVPKTMNPNVAAIPQTQQNSISEDFKWFLSGLDRIPSPQFEMKRIKTCSNADREKCATIMLEMVHRYPNWIPRFANLARPILSTGSLSSSLQKTFFVCIIELCTEDINKSFKEGIIKDWNHIDILGKFLAHIFLYDAIKPKFINDWFDKVETFTLQETAAVKTFINVLRICCFHLKVKTPIDFTRHQQTIRKLHSQCKTPPYLLPIMNEIMSLTGCAQ